MKILSKDRIRSEKGAGKQAKRWRNAGHERVPEENAVKAPGTPKPIAKRVRRAVTAAAETPP